MKKRNLLLTIAYDGTTYHGWQKQPNVETIQGELEKNLSILCNQKITIQGTGRTDAGVHARGQCATFEGTFGIPTENLLFALNNLLPPSIYVSKVEQVDQDFHARFSARGKQYVYQIMEGERDPFLRNYYYFVQKPLDVDRMKEGAKHIIGTHDFLSFQASGGEERESTIRTIFDLDIERIGKEIYLRVVGDGFLYNMVRILTGTLVEVGHKEISSNQIKEIIGAKNRTLAGHTAPAHGLYLERVYF